MKLRVASLNMSYGAVQEGRWPGLARLVRKVRPDILALQECRGWVMDGYRMALGDGADEVLAIRRDIIMLMLAEQRVDEVLPLLSELHQDMLVRKGPDAPDTAELDALLVHLQETDERPATT